MVLGIFGGTFDPIHFGHLRLAEEARAELGLERILWLPAGQPPHRAAPQVTAHHRLDMVRLATNGNPYFVVDPTEVEAAGTSYTVLTLERLRHAYGPGCALVLLVGADAFAGLASWHRWRELFALAHIAVSHRPGFPVAATSLPPELAAEFARRHLAHPTQLKDAPAGGIVSFAMTQLAISATQIRQLLAERRSARYLLPASVLDYIARHHLYTTS